MNKKTKKIAIILITSTISISLILLLILNVDVKKIENENGEITPVEEINDSQLRETVINLYYIGDNNEIKEVAEKIDSKQLAENPYKTIFELLVKNNKQVKTYIPCNTKINSITKNGECVVIDLSREFIDEMEDNTESQRKAISQIVNTMTQFNEINAVKITIDGSDELGFKNGNINFKQLFTNVDE